MVKVSDEELDIGNLLVRNLSFTKYHSFEEDRNYIYLSCRFLPLSALNGSSGAEFIKCSAKNEIKDDSNPLEVVFDTIEDLFYEIGFLLKDKENFHIRHIIRGCDE